MSAYSPTQSCTGISLFQWSTDIAGQVSALPSVQSGADARAQLKVAHEREADLQRQLEALAVDLQVLIGCTSANLPYLLW